MKLTPIFDTVILKRVTPSERRTQGGIVIPGGTKEEQCWLAEVLAVGPGKVVDGFFVEPPKQLKPGVLVTVLNFNLFRIQVDGKEIIQARAQDILSIVENDGAGHDVAK